jgi:hypothetical protein
VKCFAPFGEHNEKWYTSAAVDRTANKYIGSGREKLHP